MLITFRVSNFLSFNSEVEFSLLKGKSRQPESHVISFGSGRNAVEILKLGVIYGANASGKSNLLKAIEFGKLAIVNGLKNTFMPPSHFRLEEGKKDLSSKFEFEFETNGNLFAYGFDIVLDKYQVVNEWLVEMKKTTDKPVFERHVQNDGNSIYNSRPNFFGEDEKRFEIYAQDVSPNELLLNILGEKVWSEKSVFSLFHQIYHWFEEQLFVFGPNSQFSVSEMSANDIPFFLEQLKRFKTGIVKISLEKSDKTDQIIEKLPEKIRANLLESLGKGGTPIFSISGMRYCFSKEYDKIVVKQVLTGHKLKGSESIINFSLGAESDGTQRMFDLIPLLSVLSQGNVTVIVDEIDRSLHPEMSRNLIETMSVVSEGVASQLIMTTHESSLLDLKNLLRRDEVWFVEKNTDGESKLYSLEEYKPRFDKELRKAYLQGRFGAIPFIASPHNLGWNGTKKTTEYAEG